MEVIFFPRKDYDVEVCSHRLGKTMTFTEQTDRILPSQSFPWIYGLAQEYGIKIGFFAIYTDFANANFSAAKTALDAGDVWFDEYSMAPSIEEKIVNKESISEIEFTTAYESTLLPSFFDAIGKKPVALSYAYGNDTFKNYVCPKYLVARDSRGAESNGGTDYGVGYGSPSNVAYSLNGFKSRANTIRWYDRHVGDSSFSEGIDEMAALIDTTMANGGWLSNFTHFHSVVNNGHQSVYEQYFSMLAQKNINNDIYFAGYGEAVAYLVYRQIITKAVMYAPKLSPNTLKIVLETSNTLGVDTDLLQVPISIRFSTVGTTLAGKAIKSDCNLINEGGGSYVVEIPYARFPTATVEEDV